MSERTLVLVKPDGVRRGLIGEVIGRIERKGLKIVAMDLRTLDAETAKAHYAEHAEQAVLRRARGVHHLRPAGGLVVEGPRAIEAFRALAGATDPVKAAARHHPRRPRAGDRQNIVHGSDSPESAEREIKIFFPDLF